MFHRSLTAGFIAIAVVALAPQVAAAQPTEVPRTPWGAPDLQGVWDFRALTPLERPEELGNKAFLTQRRRRTSNRKRSRGTRNC